MINFVVVVVVVVVVVHVLDFFDFLCVCCPSVVMFLCIYPAESSWATQAEQLTSLETMEKDCNL